jgi:hypothetical protein
MAHVLSRDEMEEITLQDIHDMCREVYDSIWGQADEYDRDVKVYLHWTAGLYTQFWDDYNIQIDYDGKIYKPIDTALDDPVNGTWKRNTGSVNVSLLCCAGANTNDLGVRAPTASQLESLYMVTAVLCNALDLTPDIKHVMTHGEAADNEDGYYGAYDEDDEYGPKADCERWDLEFLETDESPEYDPWNDETRGGTIIRGKAAWYNNYYDNKVYEYFNNSADKIKSK